MILLDYLSEGTWLRLFWLAAPLIQTLSHQSSSWNLEGRWHTKIPQLHGRSGPSPQHTPSLWKDQSEVSLNGANRRLNKPPCLIRTSFQPVRPSSFIPNLAKLHLSSFLQQASTPSNNLGQANFPKSNPAREASSSLQDFSPQTTIYLNTNLERLWIPILKH